MESCEDSNSNQTSVSPSRTDERRSALVFISTFLWFRSIVISLGILIGALVIFCAEWSLMNSSSNPPTDNARISQMWNAVSEKLSEHISREPLRLCFENHTGAFIELHVHLTTGEKMFGSSDFQTSGKDAPRVCMDYPAGTPDIICTARDEAGTHHSWDMQFELPTQPQGSVVFPVTLEPNYFVLSFRNGTGAVVHRELIDGSALNYQIPVDSTIYVLGIFPRHQTFNLKLWHESDEPLSYESMVPTYRQDHWEYSTTFEGRPE